MLPRGPQGGSWGMHKAYNMRHGYVQGVAVLLIAIIGFATLVSTRESRDDKPQHAAERHPARKHYKRDGCPVAPCMDVPIACFLHGRAPLAPECLHD